MMAAGMVAGSNLRSGERLSGSSCNNLLKNYGQHHANLCGFREAKGDYLITMDDDLQNPPMKSTNWSIPLWTVMILSWDALKASSIHSFAAQAAVLSAGWTGRYSEWMKSWRWAIFVSYVGMSLTACAGIVHFRPIYLDSCSSIPPTAAMSWCVINLGWWAPLITHGERFCAWWRLFYSTTRQFRCVTVLPLASWLQPLVFY